MSLPTDAKVRKGIPIFSGFVKYFTHAIAAAAQLSRIGNDQHNPGQPLHWAKEKSKDEADALARHLSDMAIDVTHRDPDGVLAATKVFWRAGALLERLHDSGVNIFAVEPEAQKKTNAEFLAELRAERPDLFKQPEVSHEPNPYRLRD